MITPRKKIQLARMCTSPLRYLATMAKQVVFATKGHQSHQHHIARLGMLPIRKRLTTSPRTNDANRIWRTPLTDAARALWSEVLPTA